jgi:multidrug resistance efflux pump
MMFTPLAIVGCQRQPGRTLPTEAAKEEASAQAKLVTVKPERVPPREIVQPGHIEAFEQTPIYARVSGYVRAVNVDIEDQVNAGKILLEISVPELDAEVDQKEAALALAKDEVETSRKSLAVAEAKLEGAQALYDRWETEYKRLEALTKEKVIDEQTRDETKHQFKAADAMRKQRAAERDLAGAQLAAAQTKQRVADAEYKRIQAMRDFSKIEAPYQGVITLRNVHTGHTVQPPAGVKGDPLLVVERRDKYRIVVEIPEADAALVHKGDSAVVRAPAVKGWELARPVTRTAWSLDGRTRTLRAEIDWEKPDDSVRPGQYVSVSITSKQNNLWSLPASAVVVEKDGQAFCFRIRDGKLVRTPVRAGAPSGGRVVFVAPEDWMGAEERIADNAAALKNGQPADVER